ncbi:MAG: GNAT family N-acetyltransferase [Candidatus Bathyarchaeota archaeon]
MEIKLRKARPGDRDKVIWVESKSTPNLSYVPHVWDMFLGDETGDWSVAELDGEIVGCGKYTVLPDGSAWLETLRVIPERQGLGVGKRLYERWFELAHSQSVATLRMYTGTGNVVSKGLAERFGLRVAGTYKEARMQCNKGTSTKVAKFRQVADPEEATELLMPLKDKWAGFLVMNRTFYRFTPALCRYLAESGMVYADPDTCNVVTVGARFMPEDALHIGVLDGDLRSCLDFAMSTCLKRGARRLNIQYPPSAKDVHEALTGYGFSVGASDFIVMEVHLEK